MINIDRDDIHIICRHSNWSERGVDKTLKDNVYNDKVAWQKFLRLLFITLGVCFTTSGIIFFFSYNWTELNKFVKIGLIEGLIVITTFILLFFKININIKNTILTATSILVGVLFAVFGQVYQTGANAYDLFLDWSVFISLWVIISNFPPLWLTYLTLINTTIILYSQQVAFDWSKVSVYTILFILNISVLLLFIWLSNFRDEIKVPVWFSNILALASVSFATIGITIGIFVENQTSFFLLVIITAILFAAGIIYGLKEKSGFYLSVIPFSIIIILSAFFIKTSHGEGMLLFTSLFIIASVTLVIRNMIAIQKKWTNE